MRRNLVRGKIGLDFLDGLFHGAINELLVAEGPDDSGLYDYYQVRVRNRLGGILEYEEDLAQYVLRHCRGRRIVEIGTGLGELPIMLALNGLRAAGVEYERSRHRAAAKIRGRFSSYLPEISEQYELIFGGFPEILVDSPWIGPDVTLLFTNVGAGWDQDRTDRAIAFFPCVGEVILELRMFGNMRGNETDQQALFDQIAAKAKSSERLPDLPYFARFTF